MMKKSLSQTVILVLFVFFLSSILLSGCKQNTPEQKEYIAGIEKLRAENDAFMQNDPASPFKREPAVEVHPLKYFDIDPGWVFKSKLTFFDKPDSTTILGTKGEERTVFRIGYVAFSKDAKEYKVNVYRGTSKSGETYHSIWFTDKTTGGDTYGVGRYIDFELNPDSNFVYTIDFNTAYNPYCAYNPAYSCAVPSKEDYLDLRIEAGERKFHE